MSLRHGELNLLSEGFSGQQRHLRTWIKMTLPDGVAQGEVEMKAAGDVYTDFSKDL